MLGLSEADTCRLYVTPKLQAAGWDHEPYLLREQVTFTDGRIIVIGGRARRRPGKRADYLLRYRPDFTLAVVEAKAFYRSPSDGLQQAKDYAEILGLKFAYSTNGKGIVEFDYLTGAEREVVDFPDARRTLEPPQGQRGLVGPCQPSICSHRLTTSPTARPRYYQEIAINRRVQAILQGRRRILLTMATGTGKTVVAFQICWKLWWPAGTARASTGGRASSISPTATS